MAGDHQVGLNASESPDILNNNNVGKIPAWNKPLVRISVDDQGSGAWPALSKTTQLPLKSAPSRSSKSVSKKPVSVCEVHVYRGPDRITTLSNDILSIILSSLDMKDAAKTSILSKRWRYVWTHQLIDLEFDRSKWQMYCKNRKCRQNRSKFVKWVNQVLSVHHSPLINKFKVDCVFDKPDKTHVDSWIQFALSKSVKELYLDVKVSEQRTGQYSLGFDLLKNSPSPYDMANHNLSRLTSLDLIHVDVSGDFLEFLLSQCHLLERLAVKSSDKLTSFKAINSSLTLKHLIIQNCSYLKKLEIDAAGLTYFEYGASQLILFPSKGKLELLFKNVPDLVEASFMNVPRFHELPIFPQISCIASQLSKLSLNLQGRSFLRFLQSGDIPCFSNVKYLVLAVRFSKSFYNSNRETTVIKACPMLHHLTLEVDWSGEQNPVHAQELSPDFDLVEDSEDNIAVCPNLKTIMIHGFLGYSSDVKLIHEIVKFSPAIETITCKLGKYADDLLSHVFSWRCHRLGKSLPPTIRVISSNDEQ